ncbi:MAG: phospholipase D-like domain-containing protein [Actinomycetota bacterium]|nr:phospholipase D-like domain-containing protein [Actinomycetota bacterium]
MTSSAAGDHLHRIRRVLEALLDARATEGNHVEVLRNGVEIFPSMLEAIRQATSTIDFLTFIYWTGNIAREFADALSERARAGVRVRVLLDALGAREMSREFIEQMEEAGVLVEWFRKPTTWKVWEVDNRTHRKVLICDDRVGFTGGVGIAEEWEGDARDHTEWRDTHFRVEGPAVDGLTAAFVGNWMETGHPIFDEADQFPEHPAVGDTALVAVRGAAQVGLTDIAILFRTLIQLARRRLQITSAYFNPDDTYVRLLREARQRGVEVDVLIPGPHIDKRVCLLAAESEFEPLLEAGVRIWRYQPSMLHAKILTLDGMVACVGSANLNQRSMSLDEELCLVIFDPKVVEILEAHFAEDLERSKGVDPQEWQERGVGQRAKEGAIELIEGQM